MKSWGRRLLYWGLVPLIFLTLVIKIGQELISLDNEHRPPVAASLHVEKNGDRVLLSLDVQSQPEALSGLLLPVGPDEISFPGRPAVWRELAAALPYEEILRGEKHGFDGLQIVDLPSWFERRAHTHLELAHEIVDMERVGKKAYLLNSEGRVLTLDIQDPYRPVIIGYLPLEKPVKSLIVFRGALFLLAQISHEYDPVLIVMGLSDPSHPKELFRHKLPTGSKWFLPCKDYLGIQGGRSGDSQNFLNLYQTTEDHRLILHASVDGIRHDDEQLVIGDFLYVAGLRGGLKVYNILDPLKPIEVGRLIMPERLSAMARVADRLFAWGNLDNLYVIDVSTPTKPTILAKEEKGAYLFRVVFVDQYTYVFGKNGGLHIFDELPRAEELPSVPYIDADLLLTRSDRPELLPLRLDGVPPSGNRPVDRHLQGLTITRSDKVLAAGWWHDDLVLLAKGRLQLFAVNGRALTLIGQLPLPETIRWFTPAANRIYLGGDEQLLVVAPTAGGGLQLQKTIPLPQATTWSAVVLDEKLLIAAGTLGLLCFDLEDPDQPEPQASWGLPHQIAELVDLRYLATCGNRVFASAGPAGLLVGQMVDSGSLELTGWLALNGPVRDLIVSAGLCLVATPESIQVVDVRDLTALQRLGEILFLDVEQLVLAPQGFWAGLVPNKGWAVLPMPRLLLEDDGPGEKVFLSLPELRNPAIYRINLFDRHGVTEIPGTFRLAELGKKSGEV